MNASQPTVWLAADYHLPSTYSYRMPMSSMTHAPTLPTPGPATVRLALLRRSLELFGEAMTREAIFPILREMLVRIQPPESVAISPHLLRASKWSEERRAGHPRVQESLMLREVAHAKGLLTIYLQIPASAETRFRAVLHAVGYWGQTDSFACCLDIRQANPPLGECVLPLQQITFEGRLQPFFSGLATEFRDRQLSWEEVTASPQMSKNRATRQAIVLDLYIWPLVLVRHYDGHKLFQRQSLREAQVEYHERSASRPSHRPPEAKTRKMMKEKISRREENKSLSQKRTAEQRASHMKSRGVAKGEIAFERLLRSMARLGQP